jgi:hypothetical protein
LGGNRKPGRHSRLRALAAGLSLVAVSVSVAACGGGSSADSNEPAGTYQVKVTKAEFPAQQRLGQTSLLRIGARNTGKKTVPGLTVTLSIAGKEGQTSALPFGIHSPEPGLAQPDRPVWVLAENYPKRGDSPEPGGATTASAKTFDFGPLKPGAEVEGVWKLSAVKAGEYTVLYEINGGLLATSKAETAGGDKPHGSFAVSISSVPPNTIVTDNGEVVEIHKRSPQEAKPKSRGGE